MRTVSQEEGMTVVSNSADKPKREGPRSDPGGMWKLSMTLTKTSGVTDHKTQNFDTIKVKVIIPSLWFSELGPRTSLISITKDPVRNANWQILPGSRNQTLQQSPALC